MVTMNTEFFYSNEDSIPYIVSSLRQAVYRFVENEMKKAGIPGLAHTHCAIMYALYLHSGSMRLTEIAQLVNRTKPTVSVLVDLLEKKGYVARTQSEEDKRSTLVIVTKKGYSIKKTIEEITRRLKNAALKNFTSHEVQNLVDLLVKLKCNLDRNPLSQETPAHTDGRQEH